ncbi:MAG: flagellin lysine-N-methylase [Lachnospiraceae bacterium]|nr:flagellin lysine-N-methylase [Lachnospiraceae bacterium]
MKHIDLETYSDFQCSGGKCPFTCCGGWGIVIDETTAAYYQSVTGDIGNRLKRNIHTENGVSTFKLDENGDCMFLNKERLCDLVLTLGEEHLCTTCHYFPRFTFFYGNMRFAGVSVACPEVSGFFLKHSDPLKIYISEDDLILKDCNKYDQDTVQDTLGLLEWTMNLMQDRRLCIRDRIAVLLIMIRQYQDYHDNGRDTGVLMEIFSEYGNVLGIVQQAFANSRDYDTKIDFCSAVMGYYKQIEDFAGHLPELSQLVEYYSDDANTEIQISRWNRVYEWIYSDSEMTWQEHLLVYELFRYLMNAVPDGDYYGQVAMGITVIYGLILSILSLSYLRNGEEPDDDHKMMIISRVSRLVEHDGNFRRLAFQHFKEGGMTDLPYLLKLIS